MRGGAALVKVEVGVSLPIRTLPLGGNEPSDAELVSRARLGDAWAERALYRRHAPKLLRVARRILGNDADALDVLQEAFLAVFQRLGQLLDGAAFGPWLMRSGVRLASKKLKWRRFTGRVFFTHVDPSELFDPKPDAPAEVKEQLHKIGQVLTHLPADQRVAWILRYVEGYELTEVALACGVSLATGKRWIAAAHTKVQAKLTEKEGAR